VLRRVADQRSVDVLLRAIGEKDLAVRAAVLSALNRLRETAPELDYGPAFVTRQILEEARHYCELHAALKPLRDTGRRTAAGLLARSIEERAHHTVERLFRLLGLRYPPKEIYAAYLAVQHRRPEQLAAAMDFLENTLDRELKRVLLPLLDAPAHLVERGRELFGVETPDAPGAIRRLIGSGDPWLAPCAIGAAAELGLRDLTPEIERAARGAGCEAAKVARSALAALGWHGSEEPCRN
jgi:AAA family ATP:ADP antiporter